MKRALAGTLALLVLGGGAFLAFVALRLQWRTTEFVTDQSAIAAKLCRPDETLTVLRQRGSRRTNYTYYCVDAQGRRRSLSDELTAASPGHQTTFWAPIVGGSAAMVIGILVLAFGSRRARKRA